MQYKIADNNIHQSVVLNSGLVASYDIRPGNKLNALKCTVMID